MMPDDTIILFESGPLSVVQQDDGMLCVKVADSNAVYTPAQLAGLPAALLAASVPQDETERSARDTIEGND
jgi:hypothetical protein